MLAAICPNHLPSIVATRPEWNAWLTPEVDTSSRPNAKGGESAFDLEKVAAALAHLQLRASQSSHDLLDAGAFDQRMPRLHADAPDLNAGNILQDAEHVRFIDWAETYVSFPLISLQHLTLLAKPAKGRSQATLISRYRDVWSKRIGARAFDTCTVHAITGSCLHLVRKG